MILPPSTRQRRQRSEADSGLNGIIPSAESLPCATTEIGRHLVFLVGLGSTPYQFNFPKLMMLVVQRHGYRLRLKSLPLSRHAASNNDSSSIPFGTHSRILRLTPNTATCINYGASEVFSGLHSQLGECRHFTPSAIKAGTPVVSSVIFNLRP
ncbi:hypothetical protein BDW66DRAFT_135959 [Aspergillus desertorum]